MKVTLETLLNSVESLRILNATPVPISIGFKLSRTLKEIQDNLDTYDASKLSLLEKHGTPKEEGGFDIPDEKMEELEKEHAELLNTEVDINIEPISVSNLGNVQMSSSNIQRLHWLITD